MKKAVWRISEDKIKAVQANPMTFLPLKSLTKFYAVVPTADWVGRMVKAGTTR